MRVEVVRSVFAPVEVVWGVLVDWERQREWMVDARDVRVLTPEREGQGVRIVCPTNVVGFTIRDEMTVTTWTPPHRLAVRHEGRVVAGSGEFELQRRPNGTQVTWREDIDPPFGRVGDLVADLVVRPIVSRLFSKSLDNFKRLAEQEGRRQRTGGP